MSSVSEAHQPGFNQNRPVEVTPEPTAAEREALERALRELDPPEPGRSAWWREGVRESVEDELER